MSDFDEGEIFEDGLDEDLMGDEDDRVWLAQLSEKDREQELFKRVEEREVTQMRMELQKKLKHSRKRPASPEMQKPSREKRPASCSSVALKIEEVFSSDESEDDTPRLTLDHLNTARVPRSLFEKLIHYEYFRECLVGCYVRINAGYGQDDRVEYKVAEVIEVAEVSPYSLGRTRTGRALVILIDGRERTVRVEFVSNGEFTESEFQGFREGKHVLPSVDAVESKARELRALETYEATERDVEAMITEKTRFTGSEACPARRKCVLLKKLDEASDDGDWERAEGIRRELAEIETARVVEDDPILRINERNRARDRSDPVRETRREILSDPFTRRQCRPSIVSMVARVEEEKPEEVPLEEVAEERRAVSLFEAHDFEIELDLSRIGAGEARKDSSRTFSLDDYRKKTRL